MRSIVFTYPGFRSLPKGLKQLLVTSENHFFVEAKWAFAKPGPIRSKLMDYWSRVQPESNMFFRVAIGDRLK
jgi:hypothetical protein